MSAVLPPIPVVDVREGGLLRHAAQTRDRASSLREACLASFPKALIPVMPALDRAARRWLARSSSPYVQEIAQIADMLGVSGVWLLNSTYEWSCTSFAREEEGVPWLARTLDWPFPGLGRYTDVVRMQGPAGEYFNVTWPGYAGVLTAMAPYRFAACLNQAPMWRRTRHPWLRLYDLAANGLNTLLNIRHMPPEQLLRHAFESCGTYAAAKDMLESTPVARPVIYTLIGCEPGERCVIERTETGSDTREHDTSAANDWVPTRPKWEARMSAVNFMTMSWEEAGERCRARRLALAEWPGRLSYCDFDWVQPPVLNPYTRLAIAMNPQRAILRVAGYEPTSDGLLPERVTAICEVMAESIVSMPP